MKRSLLLFLAMTLLVTACQKAVTTERADNEILEIPEGGPAITSADTLTYEVITKDTGGWYGMWNDENGNLACTGLDSGSWGTAIYFPSGWKYTFVPKTKPLNMLLSASARSYKDDITINFYRNGELIKTETNSSMKGVCKLMLNTEDTIQGAAENPVLMYEVILNKMDSSKFEYNGWSGHWLTASGYSDNPLVLAFAIPSGWRYTFKPGKLPFTMGMQATPYSPAGCEITVNFYVNGQLVKTRSSFDWIYDMTYDL